MDKMIELEYNSPMAWVLLGIVVLIGVSSIVKSWNRGSEIKADINQIKNTFTESLREY